MAKCCKDGAEHHGNKKSYKDCGCEERDEQGRCCGEHRHKNRDDRCGGKGYEDGCGCRE